MDSLTELVHEMKRLINAAHQNQIHLRAFGGLAILTHSQKDPRFFQRDAPDLDFLIPKTERQKLEPFFRENEYTPDKQFNLLNGMRRQIYYSDKTPDLHVDILIGDFEMCHKLPLDDRLDVDPVTIPLADLLLSKAQVVQLNRKDAMDIISLLFNNEVGIERENVIGLDRGELQITDEERSIILERVHKIQKTFEDMPKSIAWQMRDKVGTRVRWYLEVEEVDQ